MHPVSLLQRIASKDPTKAIVCCVKKVLLYLIGTPSVGLYYSPDNERKFNETYGKLRKQGTGNTHWNSFSDASFATCHITMRSVSGSICYYRGFPIAWKTSRQTVRTNSTFESEYVAAADTLTLCESIDFRGFFGDAPDDTLWLDNQTAVTVAKTPSGQERPKSRHVALRYMKVSDAKDRIEFCPTYEQKADALTKSTVSRAIRDNIFVHNPCMVLEKQLRSKQFWNSQKAVTKGKAEKMMLTRASTTDSEGFLVNTHTEIPCCFTSVAQYFAPPERCDDCDSE